LRLELTAPLAITAAAMIMIMQQLPLVPKKAITIIWCLLPTTASIFSHQIREQATAIPPVDMMLPLLLPESFYIIVFATTLQ
jgi:hypothetical protein